MAGPGSFRPGVVRRGRLVLAGQVSVWHALVRQGASWQA